MANECIPLFSPGSTPTCSPSAAVSGKRFVKVSGARVADLVRIAPCVAGDRAFGVAARDAAIGEPVHVWAHPGDIVPVKVGAGALTAGQDVQSDATGQAIVLGAGVRLGTIVDDAAAGADGLVQLA